MIEMRLCRGSLLAAFLVCGCQFDSSGLAPGSDGAAADGTGVWIVDQSVHDLGSGYPDSRRPPDAPGSPDLFPFPDLPAPPDQSPSADLIPWCGPGSCAGCCTGPVCQNGDSNTLCGSGGLPCVNCLATLQVCDNFTCGGCTQSDQCDGQTVCVSPGPTGSCTPAYGLDYQVVIVSAVLNSSLKWDDYSAPDPYAQIQVGSQSGLSSVKPDTYTPSWIEALTHIITQTTAVTITLWDHDSMKGPDYIGEVSIGPPVPLPVLRADPYIYTSPNGAILELRLRFIPK